MNAVFYIFINECSCNRRIYCYGEQWRINWYHGMPDGVDELSHKPVSL